MPATICVGMSSSVISGFVPGNSSAVAARSARMASRMAPVMPGAPVWSTPTYDQQTGILYGAHRSTGRVLVYDTLKNQKLPELTVGKQPWIVYAEHPFQAVSGNHVVPSFVDEQASIVTPTQVLASLPRSMSGREPTVEEAVQLLAAQAEKKKAKGKAPARRAAGANGAGAAERAAPAKKKAAKPKAKAAKAKPAGAKSELIGCRVTFSVQTTLCACL